MPLLRRFLLGLPFLAVAGRIDEQSDCRLDR